MNFSAVPDKSWYGKILRLSLKFIPSNMKMPILQGKLRGKKWIVGSGNHGYWLGSYEYKKRIMFEKIVKEGSVVFDIGAHVGFYTLLASVLVGSNGRVFALEPASRNLFYLREHLRLNNCKNVVVIEAAVGDCTGITFFNEGFSSSMGHISTQGQLQVKMVSLDDLISKCEIPIPDYIKVDVEGAEMVVLSGGKSILCNNHPTIFLATHGRDIHSECCKFLSSVGYNLWPIKGNDIDKTDEIIAFKKSKEKRL